MQQLFEGHTLAGRPGFQPCEQGIGAAPWWYAYARAIGVRILVRILSVGCSFAVVEVSQALVDNAGRFADAFADGVVVLPSL